MFARRTLGKLALLPLSLAMPTEAVRANEANWRLVSSNAGAVPRWDHSLNALPGSSDLLLAFGRGANGLPLDDTLMAERTAGDWTPVDGAGPQARFGHATAMDPQRGCVYLFGGQGIGDEFFADLWAFDEVTRSWSLIHNGVEGPPARYGTALVFDGANSLILLHGFTFEGRFNDVWRFDLESLAWERIPVNGAVGPLRRCLHEAVWSRSRKRIYLYGGCSSGYGPCPQGDLWELDPATGTWTELDQVTPAGRMNPALILDESNQHLVLIGGLTSTGASDEVWTGALSADGVAWSHPERAPLQPSARSSHDVTISGGAAYLFGGAGDDGVTGDLWRLKLTDLS